MARPCPPAAAPGSRPARVKAGVAVESARESRGEGKKDGLPVTRKPHEGKKSSISTVNAPLGGVREEGRERERAEERRKVTN